MATYSKRGYKAPKEREQLMIQLKMEMLMKRQHNSGCIFNIR
jgi:hypothetical protein